MTSNFEQFDGGVSIRDKDGRYQPVPTPEGFTDTAFRNAVAAYDTAYRTLGKLPSVSEVHKYWPRIPLKTYSALFLTEEFAKALEYRGIDLLPGSGLSLEQNMALLKLTDYTDRRTTSAKLKELGIPMARYQAWLKHPLFKESLSKRTEANLSEAKDMALNRLLGNAEASDQRAIEKVLEITGRWNPAAQQVEDARTVVLAVIESVVKNVKDPEVRRAIMVDVETKVYGFDLNNRQALES